jgi:hypothetical protein
MLSHTTLMRRAFVAYIRFARAASPRVRAVVIKSPSYEQPRASYPAGMLRPRSWIRPAGGSPVRVGVGTPGSRPRFVVERRRAERGVESLVGESKHAGRSGVVASPAASTQEQSGSRAAHVTAKAMSHVLESEAGVGSLRGMGSGTGAGSGSEVERSVCPACRAWTGRISRW